MDKTYIRYLKLPIQEEKIGFLEENGYNFIIPDTYWAEIIEYTPLYYVCLKHQYDIVAYLLEHGASPTQNVYDDFGFQFDSPWDYAISRKDTRLINLMMPYVT